MVPDPQQHVALEVGVRLLHGALRTTLCYPRSPLPSPPLSSSLPLILSSGDINSHWDGMISNLNSLKGRGHFGKPGSWNDPDFLENGIGDFGVPTNGT